MQNCRKWVTKIIPNSTTDESMCDRTAKCGYRKMIYRAEEKIQWITKKQELTLKPDTRPFH